MVREITSIFPLLVARMYTILMLNWLQTFFFLLKATGFWRPTSKCCLERFSFLWIFRFLSSSHNNLFRFVKLQAKWDTHFKFINSKKFDSASPIVICSDWAVKQRSLTAADLHSSKATVLETWKLKQSLEAAMFQEKGQADEHARMQTEQMECLGETPGIVREH